MAPSDDSTLRLDDLRALLNAAPVGLSIFDASGRYTFVNRALAELNQRPPEEHLGRRPGEVSAIGERLEAHIERVLSGRDNHVRELIQSPLKTDNGTPLRFRVEYWALGDGEGAPTGIGCLVLDTTEQAAFSHALEELERGYRAVIDAAHDAIFIANAETGVVIESNQRAVELLGRPHEEIIGMHQSGLHPPGEAERYASIFEDHASSQGAIEPDLYAQHADGRRIPIEISGSPLRFRSQDAVVGLFRDVTQRRAQRQELEQANRELRKLDEMKNNLLGNVSHELRSPLVGIRGYVELLQGEPNVGSNERKWLGRIQHNVQRLERIIDELLQMTALQAGLWPLHRRPVAVGRLVDTAMAAVKPQAMQRDIDLVLEVPPDLPAVYADETQIISVLINLVDNAIKFSQRDSEVQVSATAVVPAAVRILVTDHGIGISEEHRERMFDRFYQADGSPTRPYGGFGVGLAIVKEVLNAHGGTIDVQSRPGEGTEIGFTLPLAMSRDSEPLGLSLDELPPEPSDPD